MSGSLRYTSEQREEALTVSLTALASSMGYTPVRLGGHFILKEMDSLVIYNDKSWNRWSGRGSITAGSQIDFMLAFGGAESVPDAIHKLLEFKGTSYRFAEPEQTMLSDASEADHSSRSAFKLPEKNSNYRRLFAYLIKTRGLSPDVVKDFVGRKLIYEDAAHHNVVFCGYDPDGIVRYAGMRGTADSFGMKFKADVAGNDKNYGVNIVNKDSSELKVFESVIDCMSYIDIYNDWTSNKLVLGMVEDNPLERFLQDYDHIDRITLCLDYDAAGQNAIFGYADGRVGLKQKYEDMGYEVSVAVPPIGKDFNESLNQIDRLWQNRHSSYEKRAYLIKPDRYLTLKRTESGVRFDVYGMDFSHLTDGNVNEPDITFEEMLRLPEMREKRVAFSMNEFKLVDFDSVMERAQATKERLNAESDKQRISEGIAEDMSDGLRMVARRGKGR